MGRGRWCWLTGPRARLLAGINDAEFDVSPGCPLTRVVIFQAVAVGLEDSRKGGCGPHVEGKMSPLAKCLRLKDDGMDRTYWLAPLISVSCLLIQRKGFLDRWQHAAWDKSRQTHFLAWFFCETFSWLWANCLTIMSGFFFFSLFKWSGRISWPPGSLQPTVPLSNLLWLILGLQWYFWNGNRFLEGSGRTGDTQNCPDLPKDRTSGQTLKVTTSPHCAFENIVAWVGAEVPFLSLSMQIPGSTSAGLIGLPVTSPLMYGSGMGLEWFSYPVDLAEVTCRVERRE